MNGIVHLNQNESGSELPHSIFELTVAEDEAGLRLDAWLGRRAPGGLSRVRLQSLVESGNVTVDNEPAKIRQRTVAGQRVVVTIPPAIKAEPTPEDLPLDVVFEDAHIAVINKPAGLVVHPAVGHAAGTLVNGLLHRFDDLSGINGVERPGIVHRLDKDTSGLMVVAKNDAAMTGLQKLFAENAVEKIYWALTHGAPSPSKGTIRTLMGRHPKDRKRYAVVESNGKMAITHYAVRDVKSGVAWLEVRLETGRTHQIRVHCHHAGCAILGDPAYGWRHRDKEVEGCPERQMLHAVRLGFEHPVTGERMAFERLPPEDMLLLMRRLQYGVR